jgi:hypothetical protein
LAHQTQGANPKQHNGGDHGPTPTADQPHKQQDQREAKGQKGQGEKLAEQIQHDWDDAKDGASRDAHRKGNKQAANGTLPNPQSMGRTSQDSKVILAERALKR